LGYRIRRVEMDFVEERANLHHAHCVWGEVMVSGAYKLTTLGSCC